MVLDLAYDRTDFDADSNSARISIDAGVLTISASDLVSNSDTVFSYLETPEATMTPDDSLKEQTLNGPHPDY